MPELPEVETLRRDLERDVTGRTIVTVAVSGSRTVRRQEVSDFAPRLAGRQVTGVGRRGKYLLVALDAAEDPDATDVLVVHLGMSGQLVMTQSVQAATQPHTHLKVSFADGTELRFVDPRTFGECWVSRPLGPGIPELAHLGFEPLIQPDSERLLAEGLRRTRRQLKPLLMDQRFVVGIGNIYSDEILHAARLRWDRAAATLVPGDVKGLHTAMVTTLTRAIELRGSSLVDAQYRDLSGEVGAFQVEHRVYARAEQPCLTCGTAIVRVKVSGRSCCFCPRCQV